MELIQTYKVAFDEITSRGINIRLFRANAIGSSVYLCIASGLNADQIFGGIIGLGSQVNDWIAIQTAVLECMRNVANCVLSGVPGTFTESEFNLIPNPTSVDRQRLALNPDYWKEVSKLFPNSGENHFKTIHRQNADSPWTTEKLECPFEQLKDSPLVVYRARLNEIVGDVLYRSSDRNPTNLRRLSEFLQRPVALSELESKPHFLG